MEGGSAKRQRDPDGLGDLLRAADPAAASDGLEGVERARIREAIVEEAARRVGEEAAGAFGNAWRQPALAGATLLLLAFALAHWTLFGGVAPDAAERVPDAAIETPEVSGQQADGAASADPRPAGREPQAPQTVPSVSAPPASAVSSAAIASLPLPEPGPDRAPDTPGTSTRSYLAASSTPAATSGRHPRTLYFTAPRGTQIIWTLDPQYESPIAGQRARQ